MNDIPIYRPIQAKKLTKHIYSTPIEGLFYIKIDKHRDDRGFFSQIIETPELEEVTGQKFTTQQVNYSNSKTNVVRGMHAEGWNKLVTVTHGLAFSALADIRPQSKTFKQVAYFKLGFSEKFDPEFTDYGAALFVSQGIANSICVLKGPVTYLYLVDKLYSQRDPKDNAAISIFDPALKVRWPIKQSEMILSGRDKQAISLEEHLGK